MEHTLIVDYLKNRFDFKTYFEDEEYVFMERKGKKVDVYKPTGYIIINFNLHYPNNTKDVDLIVRPLIQ